MQCISEHISLTEVLHLWVVLTCFCLHSMWLQETYGEDPHLSGVYAASYVHGLQGNDSRYVRATAGCKHFDAYAGPESIPESRFSFDAKVRSSYYSFGVLVFWFCLSFIFAVVVAVWRGILSFNLSLLLLLLMVCISFLCLPPPPFIFCPSFFFS